LVVVGTEDEVPVLPVSPVLPVFPVLPVVPVSEDPDVVSDDELPPVAPSVLEEELVSLVVVDALAPGWSWETTTPITTVAPAAVTIAPLVRSRSRALARSLSAGLVGSSGAVMGGFLAGGCAHRTMRGSTPTQDPL
jgi:hypothetical protein